MEIRRELDLQPGDELVFRLQGSEMLVRGLRKRSLVELRGALPATRPYPGRDEVRTEVKRALARRLVTERKDKPSVETGDRDG